MADATIDRRGIVVAAKTRAPPQAAPAPAYPTGGRIVADATIDRRGIVVAAKTCAPPQAAPAPAHPRGGRIVAKERNRNWRRLMRSGVPPPATTVEVALQKANPRPLAGAGGGISHLPASPTAAAPAAQAIAAIHSGARPECRASPL